MTVEVSPEFLDAVILDSFSAPFRLKSEIINGGLVHTVYDAKDIEIASSDNEYESLRLMMDLNLVAAKQPPRFGSRVNDLLKG